jgi:hypothetical protein
MTLSRRYGNEVKCIRWALSRLGKYWLSCLFSYDLQIPAISIAHPYILKTDRLSSRPRQSLFSRCSIRIWAFDSTVTRNNSTHLLHIKKIMSRTADNQSVRNNGPEPKYHGERNYWDSKSTAQNYKQAEQNALVSIHPRDEYRPRPQVQTQQQAKSQSPRVPEDTGRFTKPDPSSDGFVPNVKPLSVPTGVNTILGSSQFNDVTVRLEADIREDLSQELEDFCRLYKMGSFTKARSFFDEFLEIHLDKPYVFVIYAEMLLRQGSFHEISELDDKVMRESRGEVGQDIYPSLLKNYWCLIRLISETHEGQKIPYPNKIIGHLLEDLNSSFTVNANTSPGSIEVRMQCVFNYDSH